MQSLAQHLVHDPIDEKRLCNGIMAQVAKNSEFDISSEFIESGKLQSHTKKGD